MSSTAKPMGGASFWVYLHRDPDSDMKRGVTTRIFRWSGVLSDLFVKAFDF